MKVDPAEASKTVQKALAESAACIGQLKNRADQILQAADLVASALEEGHCLYLMGNGGSAAQCQHIAAELVGRFKLNRQPLPAVALTTDSSILTALGNDFGFEQVFSRQVEALVNPGDVVIGISTSGRSKNVIEAALVARHRKATVVALTGSAGPGLAELADISIQVNASDTDRIQEAHITILHVIAELVELALAQPEV